jgi:acetylornithine deacetylase/succinyl-diaminopimelate desuccinylase-like protein
MVNIPHFYDGVIVPPKVELATMRKLLDVKAFAARIGAKGFYDMKGRNPFVANRFLPSFEPNGIFGGYEGDGSKTIIPASATVKITCRVAPGQDAKKLFAAVAGELEKRVDKKLFDFAIEVIEEGAPAYNTPLPHKTKGSPDSVFKRAFQTLEKSAKAVTGRDLLYLRDGASIPIISTIQRELGADALCSGWPRAKARCTRPTKMCR